MSGDYLLIASIGFQLGFVEVIKNIEFAGGAGGLTNIASLITSGSRRSWRYVAIGGWSSRSASVAARALADAAASTAARSGDARRRGMLRVARPQRRWRSRSRIFAVGSGLAGLAGALYAHYFQFLSPEQFEHHPVGADPDDGGGRRHGHDAGGRCVGALLLTALPQAITFLNLPPSVMAPLQGMLFTGLVLVFLFVRPQACSANGACDRQEDAPRHR